MQNNEYRRALIMLRSLLNGYSGHARIEIRTLMGRLNIRANVPPGAQSVRAALVGRRSALYFAHPLGNLRRDMRGQAGLTVDFDPRDIGGRTLDAYSLLAVVTINDGICELALVGNINGSRENDWSRVRSVVCALYAPEPRPEDLIPAPYASPAAEIPGARIAEEEVHEGDCCPLDTAGPEQQNDDSAADETNDEGLVFDITPAAEEADDIPEEFSGFAKITLPSGCGFPYAYVGSDMLGRICCALPAAFTAEPPAGLEDYEWRGGSGEGFWVRCYVREGDPDT